MSQDIRRKKLEKIREKNTEPYPRDFVGRITINSALEKFNIIYNSAHRVENSAIIAGRVTGKRSHGDHLFLDLMDQTGQLQLHANKVSSSNLPLWLEISNLDIGDCIGCEGPLGQNPRGEPLLQVQNFILLAKCLIAPPDKHHGLKDPEMKYRHREIDLLSSADSRDLFKIRAEIVFAIRKFLNERNYVEIETPVLQPVYGGATAQPFTTLHNALGQKYYLGISSELYLKRALVGGFDRVYSVSRCFRNEGISPTHNPEFTNLEFFQTCATHETIRKLTHELITTISSKFATQSFTQEVISDFPAQDWPLSRKWIEDESIAQAWELYIDEIEIASGATDINDPDEQRERFLEKSAQRVNDNGQDFDKANPLDKNYIEALECGVLPWAGAGIGIDRLCMILMGKTNIRDVVMFPLLKNKP
jgi:lysyl-tRNA synthetase class II